GRAECVVVQVRGQVAAVGELHVDIGHSAGAQADVRGVGQGHANDGVRIQTAGMAAGSGSVQVAGEGQVGSHLPLAVDAIQVGVDHAVGGLVQQFRIEAQVRIRVVHGEAGDDAVLHGDVGPAARREQR